MPNVSSAGEKKKKALLHFYFVNGEIKMQESTSMRLEYDDGHLNSVYKRKTIPYQSSY